MALRVHHLNESRSQRILWCLEELDLPYEVVFHSRNAETRLAPPELAAIHPLGKSPLLDDDGFIVHESGAILDYLVRRHGGGRLAPDGATADFDRYQQWLHYAEGSAMLPLMLNLYVMRLGHGGVPLHARIDSEITNHLGYIDGALKGRAFLVGDSLTAADINLSFVVEVGRAFGRLGPYPGLGRYIDALHARPAYKRALERGGTYALGA
ncbi:glutathione S-transferase family protein [Zavarzinia sp. CC-PAN008]|uniref:glutathione S-transferase family protein n=1 Tax=Zavarzinia sp. CC-PAN008 TaxID=3243332 RepID=UPI003F745C4E